MRRLAPPRRAYRRQREHGGDATTEGHAATGAHRERSASVVPALMANVAKPLESRLPAGAGPLARPGHLTQQDVGAR